VLRLPRSADGGAYVSIRQRMLTYAAEAAESSDGHRDIHTRTLRQRHTYTHTQAAQISDGHRGFTCSLT
jgi:hypothetical protein